jgi:hypothetical protein
MDTTHLDVFAIDPHTLRWVDVDLTVGMDWYSRCEALNRRSRQYTAAQQTPQTSRTGDRTPLARPPTRRLYRLGRRGTGKWIIGTAIQDYRNTVLP